MKIDINIFFAVLIILGFVLVKFYFDNKKLKKENKNLKVKDEVSEVNNSIKDNFIDANKEKEKIKNEAEKIKDDNPISDSQSAVDALNKL